MTADATSAMIEEVAHRYAKKYFVDTDYRMTLKTNAQMSDDRIVGYKVTAEIRKYIDYGEW